MPTYLFACASSRHPEGQPREFTRMIHHVPVKVITQYKCACGALAKRNMVAEIQSQHVIGLTPISHSTTGDGSLAKEVEFVAGRFRRNPDGSADRNHRPFRDSGELNAYMNGRNELGDPVLNDHGTPMRRPDGSIVRRGAKLVKYSANATPSRSGIMPRRFMPSEDMGGWVGEATAKDASGVAPVKGVADAPAYRSPARRVRG